MARPKKYKIELTDDELKSLKCVFRKMKRVLMNTWQHVLKRHRICFW